MQRNMQFLLQFMIQVATCFCKAWVFKRECRWSSGCWWCYEEARQTSSLRSLWPSTWRERCLWTMQCNLSVHSGKGSVCLETSGGDQQTCEWIGAGLNRFKNPLCSGASGKNQDDWWFLYQRLNDSCMIHRKIDLHLTNIFAAAIKSSFMECRSSSVQCSSWKTYEVKSAHRKFIRSNHLKFAYFSFFFPALPY